MKIKEDTLKLLLDKISQIESRLSILEKQLPWKVEIHAPTGVHYPQGLSDHQIDSLNEYFKGVTREKDTI